MNGILSEYLDEIAVQPRGWMLVELCGDAAFHGVPGGHASCYAILSGSVRLQRTGEDMIILNRGDVQMLLSGQEHEISSGNGHATKNAPISPKQGADFPERIRLGEGEGKALILYGQLNIAWPSGLDADALPSILSLTDEFSDSGATDLRIRTFHLFADGSGASALLRNFITMLLALRLRTEPVVLSAAARARRISSGIAGVLTIIEEGLECSWSVSSLAAHAGLKRSSFAMRFTEEIGMAPMDYVTRRRMLYAAKLLERGDLTVTQICRLTGYSSVPGFIRRFTQQFGMPPGRAKGQLASTLIVHDGIAPTRHVALPSVCDRIAL